MRLDMIRTVYSLGVLLVQAVTWAGEGGAGPNLGPAEQRALASIASEDLLRHIKVLASDAFEGRAPGTMGESRTIEYLEAQFEALGLSPGHPDGHYLQTVPLVGISPHPEIAFVTPEGPLRLTFPTEGVLLSRRLEPEVTVSDSQVVFVGYGIEAPEYGWDDYKGADLRGKTLLMLINDPPVPDPGDPSRLDERMFRGRAMTYYGRWTYKYDIAAAKGAAAALIVHETGPAGYPWGVIENSSGRENMTLRESDPEATTQGAPLAVEGWMTLESARRLCAGSGVAFEGLKQAALRRDFRPLPLKCKANFTVHSRFRDVTSHNVIAKVDGTDPKLKDEYLIYTAHWDHIGRDPDREGDQIYNGAVDNASGVAALLEWAEAFALVRPKRTVLFLAVTAEEKGLLGAKYYAAHPLYPLERTLANINIDGLNVWGPTLDICVVGMGQSTLEDTLKALAAGQNRVVVPEPEPEKGYYYRSDHFEFAKQGVPALYTDEGIQFRDQPPGFGEAKRETYVTRDYHQVSDEIKPDWDLSGAVEDVQLLFQVGYRLAQGESWPEWKPGSEFKAGRDQALRAGRQGDPSRGQGADRQPEAVSR